MSARGFGVVVIALVSCSPSAPPLTEARVAEQLAAHDLMLTFETGPDPLQMASRASPGCTPTRDPTDEVKAAVAVGWIELRCESGRSHFELTPEGTRRSTKWQRHTDDSGWTYWHLSVARYERHGPIVVHRKDETDHPTRMLAFVQGRWLPNEEGELLRRAGWTEIDSRDHQAFLSLHNPDGGRYGRNAAWYLVSLRSY